MMDVLHWVFLILWLLTGFILTPFTVAFFVFLLKLKGGAPGMRGVYCLKCDDTGIRKFWARYDGGNWKKHHGASGEFTVNEPKGIIFRGKGYDHKIKEEDCFIHEGKTETIVIAGLKHMNIHFHHKFNRERIENLKLQSELSKTRVRLQIIEGRINQRASGIAEKMVATAAKLVPQPRPKTATATSK